MLGYSVLFVSLVIFWKLIRKDIAERDGVSHAIWIPTLWAGILLSRPLSMWLDFGGGTDTLEGSPLDRLFYLGMILASVVVLIRRRIVWSEVLSKNWPIFLFYAFFLVSVLWAPTPFVSFKRWIKEIGNIFVALVILTEINPQQAFRAVFVRCAYVLIPLSVVFLRYFPELGRRYLRGGQLEVVGVTTQKNSLGVLVVICGLVLIWDWLERTRPGAPVRGRLERYLPVAFFVMGSYLLYLCDSKTSIVCLVLGAVVLLASRLPFLRERVAGLGIVILGGLLGFFLLDWLFGIKGAFLRFLGRDETLTGRTEVWEVLLGLKTDPWLGTGFCSFWSDERYLSQLPDWVGKSAHNGYLEVYIDGGYLGLFFLAIMLLAIGFRLNRNLRIGENYDLVCFATFVAMLVGNLSESHWGRMSSLGFMFLLTSLVPFKTELEIVAADAPLESTEEEIYPQFPRERTT